MKKLIAAVMVMVVLMGYLTPVVSAEALVESGKSAVLIEVETGRILYEKNHHDPLEPASMTKMMPMYLILEAISDGRLTWDQAVIVSDHAASLGGTQIYLEPGEQMSVRDLFASVAIASANDAVTALGEAVSGSEAAFVELMNERASEFGMTNTVFKNPTGLPHDAHVTTAYDMALLGKRLILDFPEVTEFTTLYEDYVRENSDEPFWLVNTNKLVRYVEGVDGLKTGFTAAAGYCLTATAKRGDMRVVAVVMGAQRSELRNLEVARLIEHAFSQYELHPRLAAGSVVGTRHHILVEGRQFDVVTTVPISVLTDVSTHLGEETQELQLNEGINLPIQPGDVIGQLLYYVNGDLYQTVDLTVVEPVERTTFVALWTYTLGQLLFGGH
ncbi:MAG: D-alanyl-D-alanine carboxypeptidase [Defluviitaleaceae bacterium]|nr:D-alanyl-D-alanine carboxypeptidase [Defluviitaleaceae bacterium]